MTVIPQIKTVILSKRHLRSDHGDFEYKLNTMKNILASKLKAPNLKL